MTQLLISVRSVSEASASIHHGADRIDIKEPSRGALGMRPPATISSIVREIPPRFPVSAALGEWADWRREGRLPPVLEGLSFLKIGLAGAGQIESWREDFGRFCRESCAQAGRYSQPAWVAVAYADWERARSPRPEEVLDFAAANGFPVFLLDTWLKDGTRLFDWMDPGAISDLAGTARLAGMEVALAGSLKLSDIETALTVAPDVLAIRGAACRGGKREGGIDPDAVASIASALQSPRLALAGAR